eukprot:COSAG04_NODE_13977_length_584_cov_82.107216_1_plen_172_part_10
MQSWERMSPLIERDHGWHGWAMVRLGGCRRAVAVGPAQRSWATPPPLGITSAMHAVILQDNCPHARRYPAPIWRARQTRPRARRRWPNVSSKQCRPSAPPWGGGGGGGRPIFGGGGITTPLGAVVLGRRTHRMGAFLPLRPPWPPRGACPRKIFGGGLPEDEKKSPQLAQSV